MATITLAFLSAFICTLGINHDQQYRRSSRSPRSCILFLCGFLISPNVPPVYETLARIGATKFGRSGARKARSKTRVHLFIHARALYRLLGVVLDSPVSRRIEFSRCTPGGQSAKSFLFTIHIFNTSVVHLNYNT